MNQYTILGFAGALLVSFLLGGALGWHEMAVRVPAKLDAQQSADAAVCQKSQQLTKDTNDALHKSRDDIASKLAALKLQHTSACVRPSSSPRLPNGGEQHAGQNGAGVNTDWLRDYAAEAELYRQSLSDCAGFVAKERAAQ